MTSFTNAFHFPESSSFDRHLLQFLNAEDTRALSTCSQDFNKKKRLDSHLDRAADTALSHLGDALNSIPEPIRPRNKIKYFYWHMIPELQRAIFILNPARRIELIPCKKIDGDVMKYVKAKHKLIAHRAAKHASIFGVFALNCSMITGLNLYALRYSPSDGVGPLGCRALVTLSTLMWGATWHLMSHAKVPTREKLTALISETGAEAMRVAKEAFGSIRRALQ